MEVAKRLGMIWIWGLGLTCGAALLGPGSFAASAAEDTGERNLLMNGSFEQDEEGDAKPDHWSYAPWRVGGQWELGSVAREGRRGLCLEGVRAGYHFGPRQEVGLLPNWQYRYSAWVKAEVPQGDKVTCLYYDANYLDAKNEKKWWGGSGETLTDSSDWRHVEKDFTTPDVGTLEGHFFPVLFWGQSRVWLDDVRLVDCGPAKLGKAVFFLSFDDPGRFQLTCHQGQQPAPPPRDAYARKAPRFFEGKDCLELHYVFGTRMHDAAMLTADVKIESGRILAVTVCGDQSGHDLFVVLVDRGGESHYLPIGPVCWKGWKTVYVPLEGLTIPPNKGTVLSTHWGGDGTQALEFPIVRLTVGLNDRPDTFKGAGKIYLAQIQVFE